jgi:hypothetical protein
VAIMLNTYIDRGIIKWNAFDALVGYSSMLEEMRYRMGKKERPVLSDDDYEQLNRDLNHAMQEHLEVEIRYFHDGYARFTYGTIRRLDYAKREIVLSTMERLKADDILGLAIQ